jgi:hypothetical protein
MMLAFPDSDFLMRKYMLEAKSLKESNDPGKPGADPLKRQLGKHMLNDPIGKTIQKNHPFKWRLMINLHTLPPDTVDTKVTSSGNVWVKSRSIRIGDTPAHIGVFVYAYARALMWEALFSKYPVYYSDTDSGVLRKEDFEDLERLGWVGDGFGKFALEADDISDILFRGPKAYATVCRGTVCGRGTVCRKSDVHMKGVRKTDNITIDGEDGFTLRDDGVKIFRSMLLGSDVTSDAAMFTNSNGLKYLKLCKRM